MGHTRDRACHSLPKQELLSSMSCPLCSQFVLSSHRILSLFLVVLSEIRSHFHPIFADFLFAPCSHERRFLICNGTSSVFILVLRGTLLLLHKELINFRHVLENVLMSFLFNYMKSTEVQELMDTKLSSSQSRYFDHVQNDFYLKETCK